MSRQEIIGISALCCVFGVLALQGPEEYRTAAYVANVLLAIVSFALAGRDLVQRGWRWGYLFAGAYVLPLIGLFVYIALSSRPKLDARSAA